MTSPPHPPETSTDPEPRTIPVVGIGASAGGLAAASEFFRALPANPQMAFVVVQHLAPDHASELAKLLQTHTKLRVSEATDGRRIEPNHVYTIPPGKRLILRRGALRLLPADGRGGHVQAAIDGFFKSLAAEAGEAAACVILSGTGSDGTVGLKAIKEAGGITLAQAPSTAEYDGMPRSAVATDLVDIIGSPHELAHRLVEYRRNAATTKVPGETNDGRDSATALVRIFAIIRQRTGHDFAHYKRASILRRVGRRLNVLGLTDLAAYAQHLDQHEDEVSALFKDLLISVTGFFRDPAAWSSLEHEVIPRLFEGKTKTDTVRAWVAGCATGEEAYTLAILLCEYASRLTAPPSIQVFATDIDDSALVIARAGIYPEAIAADVGVTRLHRFFTPEADGYRVKKSLHEAVLVTAHDLLSDAPFSRLDLITCRNLLIYLNREVQESAFELFHYSLRPDAYLFLGTSESAEAAERLFSVVDKRNRIYRRRLTTGRPPSLPKVVSAQSLLGARRIQQAEDRTIAQRHRDWLLRERTTPSIVVDPDYHICHVASGGHAFLREVDGPPSRDLIAKVVPELRLDLRAALFQAFQRNERARTRPTTIALPAGPHAVQVEVTPLDEREFGGQFVEVAFLTSPAETPNVKTAPGTDADVAAKLEEELDRTRDRLQAIIEEYETANEELKASNEELQSMNEELRSTTEELETGKEELQSINEELVTVNQELRIKIAELADANSDLQNLMAAPDIGTVFLDRNLRIKRYTPRAEDMLHLQPADVGRPLRALAQKLGPDHVAQLAEEVLALKHPLERELAGDDGNCYLTRVRPYRTLDDEIEGVVLTFLDITELKRAEREMRFQANVLQQVHDAVIATDLEDRIIYLNASATERYGLTESSLGTRITDTITIHYRRGTSRAEAVEILDRTGEWRGEVDHILASGERFIVEARVTALHDQHGQRIGSLGVLRDVTDRTKAEALARERQQYLTTTLRNVPLLAAVVDADLRHRWISAPHPELDAAGWVGKRADEVLPPADAEPLVALQRDALIAADSIRRELRFHFSDGDRVYDVTADPLRDDAGTVVGLTIAGLDVTNHKANETALESAKKAAEAANLSKSAFLAAMSHELRTPLNAIVGYVGLMELGVPHKLTDPQLRQVHRIHTSARHLMQVIEDILDFARVDVGRENVDRSDVSVDELIDEVIAILEPLAQQKNVTLEIAPTDGSLALRTDSRKLRQILLNLMGNALKFTSAGRVELRIDETEGYIRFRVIDTGSGIAADELPRIFEPFWQSDSALTRRAGGTGLGLAISRRYVELLGGTITVQSEIGEGSVFTVRIPVNPAVGSSEDGTPGSTGAPAPAIA